MRWFFEHPKRILKLMDKKISKFYGPFGGLSEQFSHFSIKTYVMGVQKNHLNETVLLSTKNIC